MNAYDSVYVHRLIKQITSIWNKARDEIYKLVIGYTGRSAKMWEYEVDKYRRRLVNNKMDIVFSNMSRDIKDAVSAEIEKLELDGLRGKVDRGLIEEIRHEMDRYITNADVIANVTKEQLHTIMLRRYGSFESFKLAVAEALRKSRDEKLEGFKKRLVDTTDMLGKMGYTPDRLTSWKKGMINVIRQNYTELYRMGYGKDLTDEAKKYIEDQVQTQIPFLDKFASDLAMELQKDGKLSNRSLYRASLYGERGSALYERGRLDALPKDALVDWLLGIAEHCQDCIDRASASPYLRTRVPNMPGDGSTMCKTNCKCRIELSSKYMQYWAKTTANEPANTFVRADNEYPSYNIEELKKPQWYLVEGLEGARNVKTFGFKYGDNAVLRYESGLDLGYIKDKFDVIVSKLPSRFRNFELVVTGDNVYKTGNVLEFVGDRLFVTMDAISSNESIGMIMSELGKKRFAEMLGVTVDKLDDIKNTKIVSNPVFGKLYRAIGDKALGAVDSRFSDKVGMAFQEYFLTGSVTDVNGKEIAEAVKVMDELFGKWEGSSKLDMFVYGKDRYSGLMKYIASAKEMLNTGDASLSQLLAGYEEAEKIRQEFIKEMRKVVTDTDIKRLASMSSGDYSASKDDLKWRIKYEMRMKDAKRKLFTDLWGKVGGYDGEKFLNNITLDDSNYPDLDNKRRDTINRFLKRFTNMVNPSMVRDKEGVKVIFDKEATRAFYSMSENVIRVDPQSYTTDVFAHELGHYLHLRNMTDEEKDKIAKYYAIRTRGSAIENLGKYYGAGLSKEYTKRDKFISPYMGKYVYGHGLGEEVVSVALEYFMSRPDMLAVIDPETFNLAVCILRGAL